MRHSIGLPVLKQDLGAASRVHSGSGAVPWGRPSLRQRILSEALWMHWGPSDAWEALGALCVG
eukprot:7798295-Alexandrium_andersonii.AAC.1